MERQTPLKHPGTFHRCTCHGPSTCHTPPRPPSHHTIHNLNDFSIPVHSAIPLNVISHHISELYQFNSRTLGVSLCISMCLRVSVFIATVAGNMQPVFSTASCCCFKPLRGLTPTQTGTGYKLQPDGWLLLLFSS